ncbi:MAG: OmpA family protein [Deltaproteobacteria bacterium]|nr:OmpA family protein [Deltaproteobacteria bacterium]
MILLATLAHALDAHGFELFGTTGDPAAFSRLGTAFAGRSGSWDTLMAFDYADRPLSEVMPWGREPVLSSLGTVQFAGGYSFGGLRLDAALPVHAFGEDLSGSFTSLGDLRAGVLVPALRGKGWMPQVALQGNLWAPTGDESHYVGSAGPRAGLLALAEVHQGNIDILGMAGLQASFPEEARNLDTGLGPLVGLGVGYSWNDAITTQVEFSSQSDVVSESWPLEAMVSGRYRLPQGAFASVGAAAGLNDGVGAASWRAFLSVGWTYTRPAPPAPPPEIDPNLDTDGDGFPDIVDQCDDMPETVDGFADDDGCPEFDGDQDGVEFARDACPREPIHPEQDPRYSDGCPKVAEWAGDRIVITEAIFFREGRAELLPSATPVLEAVRDVMVSHPEIAYFLVEGHTNTNGPDAYNLRLSDARAYAVMDWLVGHGVEPKRLLSKGFGETRLLVPETDPDAEAINRRVEFRVAAVEDLPVDARQVVVPEDVRR